MATEIDKYTVVARIGAGGTAEIFLAEVRGPESFRKRLALKVLLPQFAADPDFRAMFIKEARLVSDLTHHNIVQVHELGEWYGRFWIAMEYVGGPDLGRVLDKLRESGKRMPVAIAVRIGHEVLRALSFAHGLRDANGCALDIVHRDVSPSNVLLAPDGSTKLTDFGIAKATLSDVRTRTGILKGKLAYMSPEQAFSKRVDARADLFSVGALLYEMISGQARLSGGGEFELLKQARAAAHTPLAALMPDLPANLVATVERALSKEPSERFQNAGEFLAALDTLATTQANESEVAAFIATLDIDRHLAFDAGDEVYPLFAPLAKRPAPSKWLPWALSLTFIATVGVWTAAHRAKPAEPVRQIEPTSEPIASPPASQPVKSEPSVSAPSEARGFLAINSNPWARVTVDGVQVARETPLLHYPLPPGRHHVHLETQRGDHSDFDIDVVAGRTVTKTIAFPPPTPVAP